MCSVCGYSLSDHLSSVHHGTSKCKHQSLMAFEEPHYIHDTRSESQQPARDPGLIPVGQEVNADGVGVSQHWE
ncbi:hypothetical protein RRG08_008911 [Elysia crispata]|uniref:Uncharacterized protein n=1 Tax=Elysia crispata TaxID=231223 RepID=A0AAE0ZX02_9GAST|nr:hypothetical protein RRG08_008911 [Elysia crispata]